MSRTRLAASMMLALGAVAARADLVDYLVGVQIYASGPTGQNAGAYSATAYQYSTNSNTDQFGLDVNGTPSLAISLALANGPNVFTFSGGTGFPIDIIGLNLFFNDTGTSYNPAYQAGVGIPGDLSAYVAAGSSTFSIPVAGTDVQSYNTSFTNVNSTTYSGATSFTVGNSVITLTDFSAANTPSGSFTLTVTPTPEPRMFVALGLGLALLALTLRRT